MSMIMHKFTAEHFIKTLAVYPIYRLQKKILLLSIKR